MSVLYILFAPNAWAQHSHPTLGQRLFTTANFAAHITVTFIACVNMRVGEHHRTAAVVLAVAVVAAAVVMCVCVRVCVRACVRECVRA